ncbi:IS110 family transposase [Myroides odoratimimus]|uniref:IS110 family transposase n=1 Tax=Myroides odoratimimus TaxID=76832 RepID=UPI002574B612|nr:IS110 family transposase [Myroides odoratimimus]MDM1483604.1 IS110 family transposase [Myroides odoratimimus]MDM1513390.1 IS110 family transposase [Myroides odoratimimus]
MNKFNHFVGIDISKEYFDATLFNGLTTLEHNQFNNSKKGVDELIDWIKGFKASLEKTLICMEHTGIYKNFLVDILSSNKCNLWIEMPLRIIKSSGVQKGKNDKIDSQRIAMYAHRFQDKAMLFSGSKIVLDKLHALSKQRRMYLTSKSAIQTRLKEQKLFDKEIYNTLFENDNKIINLYENIIEDIDNQLDKLIKENQEILEVYQFATSVRGVGPRTAIALICYTKNFTTFNTPRELASYCGVVPFQHTSGKSIRGKNKVHFMANKDLKRLLHLCAVSCVQSDPEIKTFYERKQEEGKHKMSILNSVRNKLIHRICACVRDRKMYVEKQVI